MSLLEIQLHQPHTIYRPSERLTGRVRWQLSRPATSVELRLIWFMAGSSIPEAGVVEVIRFDRPRREEERGFEFMLPEGPYSYIGIYGALTWGVEVVTLPAQEHVLTRFELCPSDQPIKLFLTGQAGDAPPGI